MYVYYANLEIIEILILVGLHTYDMLNLCLFTQLQPNNT